LEYLPPTIEPFLVTGHSFAIEAIMVSSFDEIANSMDLVFYFLILIVSIILHEVAHGYMANYLGDPTARLMGRLTLNPISHIDPLGTIMIPAFLIFTQSPFFIGYAKPVPYNPHNLPGRYDELLVAAAGPAVNFVISLVFGLSIRLLALPPDSPLFSAFITVTIANLWLMLFNLIPIPPLDGSKVLSGLLPGALGRAYDGLRLTIERIGTLGGLLVILLAFYVVLGPVLVSLLKALTFLLTGASL
jgi:Zn-dependent protease